MAHVIAREYEIESNTSKRNLSTLELPKLCGQYRCCKYCISKSIMHIFFAMQELLEKKAKWPSGLPTFVPAFACIKNHRFSNLTKDAVGRDVGY